MLINIIDISKKNETKTLYNLYTCYRIITYDTI